VLATLSTMLTGPWMKLFYADSSSNLSHADAIRIVDQAILLTLSALWIKQSC
jgi:hypothetical protein